MTIGRRRSWYGQRSPARYAVVRLGAIVPASAAPSPVVALADWVRRLHRHALARRVSVSIHRTSEPGHWVVAYPWREQEKAELIAEAALRLVDQPSDRLLARALTAYRRGGQQPAGVDHRRAVARHARRAVPLISVSGTNGKSTTTRMITHIARRAGLRVGTTTTDGVLIDEQMVEAGDFTGPQGARAVLTNPAVDLAVLETARGGILLRGLGYESNQASVLTNISPDHLDLQGAAHAARAGRGQVGHLPGDPARRHGGPERRRSPGGGRGASRPRARAPVQPATGRGACPCPPCPGRSGFGARRTAGWSSATVRAPADRGGHRHPSHARRPGTAQRRQRAGRGGRRARAGPALRGHRRRAARLPQLVRR